jgi:hypothetical protein
VHICTNKRLHNTYTHSHAHTLQASFQEWWNAFSFATRFHTRALAHTQYTHKRLHERTKVCNHARTLTLTLPFTHQRFHAKKALPQGGKNARLHSSTRARTTLSCSQAYTYERLHALTVGCLHARKNARLTARILAITHACMHTCIREH